MPPPVSRDEALPVKLHRDLRRSYTVATPRLLPRRMTVNKDLRSTRSCRSTHGCGCATMDFERVLRMGAYANGSSDR